MLEAQQEIMQDSLEWFPDKAQDLIYQVLALNGEAGEVANVLKKLERGSMPWGEEARHELAMELADVYIYLLQCANIIGIDIVGAYAVKREENVKRFGSKLHIAGKPDTGTKPGIRRIDSGPASNGSNPVSEPGQPDEDPGSVS